MKILALDLATNTGFARNYGPEPRTGSESFKRPSGISIGATFDAFECWLERQPVPDIFAIEEPHVHGMGAARLLLGLHAIVSKKAWLTEREAVFVKSRDLKLTFTGYGSAKKEDMIRMARERGYAIGQKKEGKKMIDDDDEADACLLLEYMLELKGLKTKEQ